MSEGLSVMCMWQSNRLLAKKDRLVLREKCFQSQAIHEIIAIIGSNFFPQEISCIVSFEFKHIFGRSGKGQITSLVTTFRS